MGIDMGIERLVHSERWINFLDSTAVGLQLNIVLLFGDGEQLLVPSACPTCGRPFRELSAGEILRFSEISIGSLLELVLDDGLQAAGIWLNGNLRALLRVCPHCSDISQLSLKDRAYTAFRLLSSFQAAISEGFEGGQRAVELSTLRRMNHVVLSLFSGDEQASTKSFDLILSALIILLDAEGSWLELDEAREPLQRGDTDAIAAYLRTGSGVAQVVELQSGSVHGKLGVLSPASPEQATTLLPLLAQECIIVLEINRLFRLLQKQLHMILGAVGSAVVLIDRHGNVTYANPAAVELFALPTHELIGCPHTVIPGPWANALLMAKQKRVGSGMEVLTVGRQDHWVDWQLAPLQDNDEIFGWILLVDDRTDYHRWQEAAHRAERFAAIATMVGTLAHELRNPLSAARGLLQLMDRKRDVESVRGYNDLVMREIDRVIKLLNEFLLLGKPASITAEPLELQPFLEELLPLLLDEAAPAGVELIAHTDPVPAVAADPGQLTQVVLNLVRNAVEAVGTLGRVELRLGHNNGWVELTVADNGPGIHPDVMGKLFQPFFTTKERGAGLGLPIAQAIVNNHGGTIKGENSDQGGAVFRVGLPARNLRESKAEIRLVVEDPAVRYPCEHAIRAAGYSVASSAELGDSLRTNQVAGLRLAILDQQAYRQLGAKPPALQVLVVGNQGGVGDETTEVDLIPQPVDYALLISKIHLKMSGGD